MNRLTRLLVLSLVVAACAAPVPTSSAMPSGVPSSATPATPSPLPDGSVVDSIQLNTIEPGLECDAITVPYRRVTFGIGAESVMVQTDTGAVLDTYWDDGFTAQADPEPVVLAPDGSVVVTDGDHLEIPIRAWPHIGPYFVCPSPRALYIFLTDPI